MTRAFSRISHFPLLAVLLATAATACTTTSLPIGVEEGRGNGTAGADDTPAAGPYEGLPDEIGQQRLEWADCGAPTALQGAAVTGEPRDLPDGTPWQCAPLTVPVDYADPEGATIEIALIRAVSSAPEDTRVGSLVFNFGGPGGSGVGTLPSAAAEYEELRAGGFDLVSFDPRGVGESAGIVCLDDAELDEYDQTLDSSPDTPEEEAANEAANEEYIAACEEHSGELLPHVTTTNTARDMDVLRHVLGDERLNYFGISYGTELGAVYAHLFPGKVGRTVLDAVVDPRSDPVAVALLDAEGFQLALDHYLADCATQPDCPTGDDPAAGNDVLSGLLDDLDDAPLPTRDPDRRRLTQGQATTAIAAALYSQDSWEYLTIGLTEALDEGDGSTLLLLADFYIGRDPATGQYSNQGPANAAIRCADDPSGMTVPELLEHEDEFVEASPVFGEFMVRGLSGCTGWPFTESPEPPAYDAPDAAAPLLLVATTGDPATPYAGAQRMQEAIGGADVAPLLTYDGEGHSAYTSGDDCVVEAVNARLLEGTVPEDGTTCG
ncbi:alpha/beta hydrolase [Streptomyces litchfieldiae]|uniref:Alpha/beta hydrolase n=1 Tax=Streptomyces litchfieldiae TaxID=3075543 RepID=A0ABU2MLR3_9ACTN|nr:alpha/beta hydrolase [Streptomyces sp. DSM 44938]MDT0342544.1 alpha/beta hydrolase [Streptomyces sp. DSM 44938]